MNRLIILGNGFDLAHGLKTGFDHFLFYFIKKCLISFQKTGTTNNLLLSIRNLNSPLEAVDFDKMQELENAKDLDVWATNSKLQMNYNGILSEAMRSSDLDKWSDLESIYFSYLKRTVKGALSRGRDLTKSQIKPFHDNFKILIDQYEDYLINIVKPDRIVLDGFKSILNRPLMIENTESLGEAAILNFNYTNLISGYNTRKLTTQINIHGQIGNNDIVLGYGDEHHEVYREIENMNVNELLSHSKSSAYLRDNSYKNLVKFLQKTDYEIFIIGHSCGLSDRTLLKRIFEDEKCKSIRVFYYQSIDNYTNTTFEISRHFDDKNKFRDKVISFSEDDRCTQFDD